MLSVQQAQAAVLGDVGVLDAETVAIAGALGRVLREDVRAEFDVPHADNSAMDGYAVRSEDVVAATSSAAVSLRVIDDLPAGSISRMQVEKGAAIRIMTGAPIPDGADSVVPVELTDAGSDVVKIHQPVAPGAHLRRRGEDMRSGETVLADGTLIGPAELGVLATLRKRFLLTGRRPRVAILSTGDELVGIDERMTPGKVVNSNAHSLAALAEQAGGIPAVMAAIPDDLGKTIAMIESALDCDFLVSSGGVSAGAYDYVKDALDALGAETRFWQVSMKPGKPVVLSRLRDRLYFGLPGNPVSCMVSFILFVEPALRKAMGQRENLLPPEVMIRCEQTLRSPGNRRTYLRVHVVAQGGELVSIPMRAQGSGISTSMLGANGLAIMEEGVTVLEAGSLVPTLLIGPIRRS